MSITVTVAAQIIYKENVESLTQCVVADVEEAQRISDWWPNFVEVSIVMGGTPVAGWFIREIPSIFQWMIWAFPHSWTPPPSWELLDIIHYMYYYDLKYVYNYYYMYIVFHMHYNYYIIHCPESMGISATGGGRDYPLTH